MHLPQRASRKNQARSERIAIARRLFLPHPSPREVSPSREVEACVCQSPLSIGGRISPRPQEEACIFHSFERMSLTAGRASPREPSTEDEAFDCQSPLRQLLTDERPSD